MPTLTVTGEHDPFLHISLQQGESISCESDAMVMMESNLDLTAHMQGGLLGALARRLVNGESFFSNTFKPHAVQAIACLRPHFQATLKCWTWARCNTKLPTPPIWQPHQVWV